MPFYRVILLCCALAMLLGRQAFAQDDPLNSVQENRYLYCDDLVEVCPNPDEIENLLIDYEMFINDSRVYMSKSYMEMFQKRLLETLRMGNLQNLWLDGNFKYLPADITRHKKLRKLIIELDSIAAFPASVGELPSLTHLYLEHSRLLPAGISYFKNLQVLKVRAPNATQLPRDITTMRGLQTFVMLENKILEMHPHIGEMQGLETLYWTGRLETLPTGIKSLKNLRTLYLPTNKIRNLPAEIGELDNLEVLDLYANNLRNLPPQIAQLKKLKKLNLKGNTFEDLVITPELYAFFLRLNNGNNEVIGFLMDKFRMKEELAHEQAELARAQAEKEQALQKARATEAEAKRQAEAARANKAEALQQAETARRVQEQLKGQQLEREAILAKQKANLEEAKRLKAENAEKNAQLLAKEKAHQTREAQRNMYFLVLGVVSLLVVGVITLFNLRKQRRLNALLETQKQEIEAQKAKADQLLLNILPAEVAYELKEKGYTEVQYFESASVLFADVQGFSRLAKMLSPQELIKELDFCFSAFDEIAKKHRLERIKTIGDNYMCAGGVPNANQTHAQDIVAAAIEMQLWMQTQFEARRRQGQEYWKIRIGIHTGELVAGVIGKTKFAYDLWGDTVNTASRMESAGEVDKVNISQSTFMLVKDNFVCTPRGAIEAKNIGKIEAYFVESSKYES